MPPLLTDLFDYEVPSHLVAQVPSARRDASRLLVVHRETRRLEHRTFADLPDYLASGDILLRNNAAVLPARLFARRPTGGAVECFLLRPSGETNCWRCLVKPGRRLQVGARFAHSTGAFAGKILARESDGTAVVQFETAGGESIAAVANRLGVVPLPPYIERRVDPDHSDLRQALDRERYQTVYAETSRQVAVAAPTAGLHFTPELLSRLSAQGIRFGDVTLHVGLGTFQPIASPTVETHPIHREVYEVPAFTQHLFFPPATGRRVAVGTTTVRSVEDFLATHRSPEPTDAPFMAEAGLFIYPPREFRGIDALITNFHQPRSTLLCLVAAFLTPGSIAGISWIREIYHEAVTREYRFFSYGDAMLIL